jgi:hypothetical protein
MRTLIALGAAALVALAAPAAGGAKHDGKRAKVYRAKITATAAATAAGIPDARGRAQLVDGKKRNKVSLRTKGLEAGETYLWHVHQATAEGDPCAADSTVGNPTPYPGWEYRQLTANTSGNANSKGRSTTFPVAAPGADYYVNVHLLDGTVVACGVLERKRHKRETNAGSRDPKPGQARSRGHEQHGNGRGDDRHDHGVD